MFIQTNEVDWDKPIVYYNGELTYRAKCVSNRYKGKAPDLALYRAVMIELEDEDIIIFTCQKGTMSNLNVGIKCNPKNNRVIFNYNPECDTELLQLKDMKNLGDL